MENFLKQRKKESSPSSSIKPQPATSTKSAPIPTTTTTATSSTTTTSSSAAKFTIQQKIQTGTAPKKGPKSVKRTVDPKEVVIKRRIGEGSKPLFSRTEIQVNRSPSPVKKKRRNRTTSPSPTSSSSSSSSGSSRFSVRKKSNISPVRKASPPVVKNNRRRRSSDKKSPEKVPYYLDQVREKDRIKRVYGPRRSRSVSSERRHSKHRSRDRSKSRSRSRNRTRTRTRTRSPISFNLKFHPQYQKPRSRNYDDYRSRYDRSRSGSREPRRRYRDESNDRRLQHPPATQFIPIPVPVEYPFIPGWVPPMLHPPPRGRFPFMMRPPPPGVHFMPRQFPPMRFYGPNVRNYRPRKP